MNSDFLSRSVEVLPFVPLFNIATSSVFVGWMVGWSVDWFVDSPISSCLHLFLKQSSITIHKSCTFLLLKSRSNLNESIQNDVIQQGWVHVYPNSMKVGRGCLKIYPCTPKKANYHCQMDHQPSDRQTDSRLMSCLPPTKNNIQNDKLDNQRKDHRKTILVNQKKNF